MHCTCTRFWVNCKVYTAMILVIGLAVGVVVAKVLSLSLSLFASIFIIKVVCYYLLYIANPNYSTNR